MRIVALIPARACSKRVPGKNFKPLNGIPLVVWTIRAANEAGIFDDVVVWSEFEEGNVTAKLPSMGPFVFDRKQYEAAVARAAAPA